MHASSSGPETIKVNVGCGPDVIRGWINVDKSPSVFLAPTPRLRKVLFAARLLTPQQASGFPVGVVYSDASRRIPVDDESADFIYSAHMIEHLSPWAAAAFFAECRRVLHPGGVLRLATPDLERLITDYQVGSSPFLDRETTRADAFCAEYNAYRDRPGNQIRRFISKIAGGDSHQWLYDFTSLSRRLAEAGFTQIVRCRFREGAVPDLSEIEHRERSLFVEAAAPF